MFRRTFPLRGGLRKKTRTNIREVSSLIPEAWIPIILTAIFIFLATLTPELQFVLGVLAILYFSFKRECSPFIRPLFLMLCPWLLFIILGLSISLSDGEIGFGTLKGFWYESRVPVFIIFGALLALQVKSGLWIIKVLITAGILLALQFIIAYVSDPNVASVADRYYVRSHIGTGGLGIALALTVAIAWLWTSKNLTLKTRVLLLFMCSILFSSIFLANSRSSFITIALISLISLRIFPLAGFARGVIPVLLIILVFLSTPEIELFVQPDALQRYAASAPEGISELIPINRETDYEMQNYWRGFETYLAFSHIKNYGTIASLAGAGLHDVVKAPPESHFQEELNNEIPIFHNGFSFIVVRGGLIGIVLFIMQCSIFASRSVVLTTSPDNFKRFFGYFTCGLLLASILQIPTIAGFINYHEEGSTSCILIGYAMGLSMIERNPKVSKSSKLRAKSRTQTIQAAAAQMAVFQPNSRQIILPV